MGRSLAWGGGRGARALDGPQAAQARGPTPGRGSRAGPLSPSAGPPVFSVPLGPSSLAWWGKWPPSAHKEGQAHGTVVMPPLQGAHGPAKRNEWVVLRV